MKKKISKGAIALIIAIALMAVGGIGSVRAALLPPSQDFTAWFYLNHLQVHLIENGVDVCGGENTLDGGSKVTGQLLSEEHNSPIGYVDDEHLGSIVPGRIYSETLAAQNGSDIDMFVRMTIRKYWYNTKTGQKATDLLPSRIHLMYGDAEYNTASWQINPAEHTTESETYYYTPDLDPGVTSEPLFDRLYIDGDLAESMREPKVDQINGKTVYTYEYYYDGYACFIEADVQAIQTHNVNDAIRSQWGINNVTGSYTMDETGGGSGSLSVG